jgi:hypothetical protein
MKTNTKNTKTSNKTSKKTKLNQDSPEWVSDESLVKCNNLSKKWRSIFELIHYLYICLTGNVFYA